MTDCAEEIWNHWPFRDQPPRRVVIKVGSNVLALKEGGLNRERIAALVDAIAAMKQNGTEVLVVSSGAVAAGRGLLGMTRRPTDIPALQAVAAIGQGALIEEYAGQFRRHGLLVGQILLNRDDMNDRRRYLNARLALGELLQRNVVPVINENDSVTIDELKFGDNDMLSALVAAKMDAGLLLILSNIPGLMTGHPRKDPSARIIPVVQNITAEHEALVDLESSDYGTGGMGTKLLAARHATRFGVTTVIVDGTRDGKIAHVLSGRFEGTLFLPQKKRRSGSARRHWLTSSRPKGRIIIDAGAAKALQSRGKSLLPVGVRAVEGEFGKGDVVAIRVEGGAEIAQGIVNFESDDVLRIMGRKAAELQAILGTVTYTEVVHCDNMVLLDQHPG